MRRLVQGNQALLIIRQVLALVKLWELELPSVFHIFHRNNYSLSHTIAVTLNNQKIQSTYFRVELTH